MVKKLKAELAKAVEEIRAKDAMISRFKDWQMADRYLQDDEKIRDAIEGNRVKVDQLYDQETKEMAEAAA
jgi:hypothetical protein